MMDKLTFLNFYLRTRFRSFQSREDLLAWQDEQVRRFLERIVPQSPFYAGRFAGLDLTDWRNFPMIDKQAMMENLDTLNTVGLRKADMMRVALQAEQSRDFSSTLDGVTVGLSSGTSGNRGVFVLSPVERLKWAAFAIAKVMPDAVYTPHRVAFFLRANSNVYTTIQSSRVQFVYFDLLKSPVAHTETLNDLQPTVLIAPPSMLRYLAEAVKARKLHIEPRKIISVAEVLDPLDQSVIEGAFQQILHQAYQATEGFIACTCEKGVLHLNEDLLAVQQDVIDGENRKFSPIITDFNRTSQPIIRYRLDDVITYRSVPCACGAPTLALEHIEGRQDDVFYVTSANGDDVMVFPDYIRRAVIAASEQITAYRVEQTAPDEMHVYIHVKTVDLSAVQRVVIEEIQAVIQRAGGRSPHIYVHELPDEAPSATKRRRVVRQFKREK